MKNNKLLIGAFALGALLSGACSDLESETYEGFNSTVFPKTEDDVNTLLAGQFYEQFNCDWTGMYSADKGTTGSVDYVALRFADIVTLQAEALARNSNAVTDEAVSLLNRVRVRAGLKEYKTSDFASLQDFLDAVLLERGHEGWFEGWRRADLIRHGKFIDYARKYKGSVTADERHLLFPISQDIITEGRGQVIQNPGY